MGNNDVIFVQVKTNSKPTKKWMEEAGMWRVDNIHIQTEVVIYKDYQRGDKPWQTIILAKSCYNLG